MRPHVLPHRALKTLQYELADGCGARATDATDSLLVVNLKAAKAIGLAISETLSRTRSLIDPPDLLRSALRLKSPADNRSSNLSFRVEWANPIKGNGLQVDQGLIQ